MIRARNIEEPSGDKGSTHPTTTTGNGSTSITTTTTTTAGAAAVPASPGKSNPILPPPPPPKRSNSNPELATFFGQGLAGVLSSATGGGSSSNHPLVAANKRKNSFKWRKGEHPHHHHHHHHHPHWMVQVPKRMLWSTTGFFFLVPIVVWCLKSSILSSPRKNANRAHDAGLRVRYKTATNKNFVNWIEEHLPPEEDAGDSISEDEEETGAATGVGAIFLPEPIGDDGDKKKNNTSSSTEEEKEDRIAHDVFRQEHFLRKKEANAASKSKEGKGANDAVHSSKILRGSNERSEIVDELKDLKDATLETIEQSKTKKKEEEEEMPMSSTKNEVDKDEKEVDADDESSTNNNKYDDEDENGDGVPASYNKKRKDKETRKGGKR